MVSVHTISSYLLSLIFFFGNVYTAQEWPMFTFRTWTVSQCATLPEICNVVFTSDFYLFFDWEAEAHSHHLVVVFFNMMALYVAFASFPQGFRLIKIHIAETYDQLWEGNWIGENCGLPIITISSKYKSSLSVKEWSAFSITFVSMVLLPYRFSHILSL